MKTEWPPEASSDKNEEIKENIEETKEKKSLFRPVAKAAVAFSILANQAMASTPVTPETAKGVGTETVAMPRVPSGEEVVTPEDFEAKTSMDLIDYFKTDKADIKLENIDEMQNEIKGFLASIDKNNIERVLSCKLKITGSSDERQTNQWGELGNTALTQARMDTAQKVLSEAIQNFDFSKSGLTAEQIAQIKQIPFVLVPVEYTGYEKGVTPLTSFGNSATGKNYTEEEIANLDEDKKEALYQLARKVTVSLQVADLARFLKTNELTPKVGGLSEQEMYAHLIKNVFGKQYAKAALIFDNSPSMKDSKELMGKSFEESSSMLPKYLTLGTFSDVLDSLMETKNPKATLDKVFTGTGRGDEKIGHSIRDALVSLKKANQTMPPELKNERGAVVAVTDESIQDLSYAYLKELKSQAVEANADVYVILLSDTLGKTVMISLPEIEESFKYAFDNNKEIQGQLSLYKIHIENFENSLHSAKTQKEKDHFQSLIKNENNVRDAYIANKVVPVSNYFAGKTAYMNLTQTQ